MQLSKLSPTDQRLVAAGLVCQNHFVQAVAESVKKTDTMSAKQRKVLKNPSPVRTGSYSHYYDEYDSTEAAMEDNDFADAMGGSPWGD